MEFMVKLVRARAGYAWLENNARGNGRGDKAVRAAEAPESIVSRGAAHGRGGTREFEGASRRDYKGGARGLAERYRSVDR